MHYKTGLDVSIYACCMLCDRQAISFGTVRENSLIMKQGRVDSLCLLLSAL